VFWATRPPEHHVDVAGGQQPLCVAAEHVRVIQNGENRKLPGAEAGEEVRGMFLFRRLAATPR